MPRMTERERFLRAFHDAQPGITSRALARSGVYEKFAARVPPGRVLDLACGDGALAGLLGGACIGVDVSATELDAARRRARDTGAACAFVRARAQELPFADASFDAVTCQLAFMLFEEIEQVVAELARVLKPGAPFFALLGGGPSAEGADAFHRFAQLLPRGSGFGDRRASSEAGWRQLFAGWHDVTFERWALDLSGRFDDVWRFLGASYQLSAREHDRVRETLRAAFTGEHVPCTVVTFFARVTR
jgi:SAM-dependent methyltransferase